MKNEEFSAELYFFIFHFSLFTFFCTFVAEYKLLVMK